MSEIVVRVENLGKRYVLGREFKPAPTLLGKAAQYAAGTFHWLSDQVSGPNPDQILWALRNISFEIKRGEAIGFIGRNGAGKSTLLKILSRITEPTEGFAEIKGRVGTLLEVGTGMHPELTGRENAYMNATLLGMTKREVDSKFDEIVDFSGVEKFIDTPVKRYSSGMRVRLGFAIAAHFEPEILIVDEVLAVGDAEFQKKCLGKMQDVTSHGRTVLFVSHNMDAIQRLCQTAILLENGQMVMNGEISTVTSQYLQPAVESPGEAFIDESWAGRRRQKGTSKITAMRILDSEGNISSNFRVHNSVTLEAEVDDVGKNGFAFEFYINNERGVNIYHLRSHESSAQTTNRPGKSRIRVTLPDIMVNIGKYGVTGRLRNHMNRTEDYVENAVAFNIYSLGDTGKQLKSIIHDTGTWEVY